MDFENMFKRHKEGSLSYKDGVALFFALYPDKSDALGAFFASEDRFSRSRLKQALDAHLDSVTPITPVPASEHQISRKKKPIDMEKLTPELRQAYVRAMECHREIALLRGKLMAARTDAERLPIAGRIVRLAQERIGLYARIDHYQDHGVDFKTEEKKSPPAEITTEKNFEIEYKIKLLRSRRSKVKKNPARVKELQDLDKEISDLEKKRYL